MARLDIILEGDPRLRQKSIRIRNVDASLRKLAADMRETMLDAPGVGLAAPQIGVNRRLIVMYVPEDEEEGTPEIDLALVNPEIVRSQGSQTGPEGCLSIPGWAGDVTRAEAVTVRAMDLDNREIRLKLRGYPAVVVQHEIDHLDGILFVDKVIKDTLRRVDDDDSTEPAA